ncbi:hypothetical protein MARCHEWKA_02390 [Brevundimonas phage vB_BpoS-Marchewka]|uniref:Uncharacterized protein n=1 Tax=Brevundimonas phage vB_BpoS-Marchewka TaxID=2948604 RepID=A0A9E7N2M6_9CAUD|nr:hypothetical protein MARCHEWKA_02390 [Brevundimonas phage vB_BpoS-Marchewka]UTC29198.1 hypothetical protein BAMBUS_01160 [Brevundimonas phage vB_BpoS-Bambus]
MTYGRDSSKAYNVFFSAFAFLCLGSMVVCIAVFTAKQGLIYPFWIKPDPAAVAVARDIRERPDRWEIDPYMAARSDGSLSVWWPNGAWGVAVCANTKQCFGDSAGLNDASRYVIYAAIEDTLAPRLHAANKDAIWKAAQ